MPVAKKRKTKTPDEVPELGDPERKRVLNVLAQRRYRQKRKEKMATLEARVEARTETRTETRTVGVGGLEESCTGFDQVVEDAGGIVQFGSLNVGCGVQDVQDAGLDDGLVDVEEIIRSTSDDVYPVINLDANIDFSQDLDFATFNPPFFTALSPSSPSNPSNPSNSNPSTSPSPCFPLSPDNTTLSIPIFATLHAFVTIATALDVAIHVFNPNYIHILTPPPSAFAILPPNLHPTPAQLQIPHHPALDLLPWPSVREKLICMFAMPSAFRPAIARDDDDGSGTGQSKAIAQLIIDVDETGEECRVHGNMTAWGAGNEMVEEAWEVGERFFENWWWCLDGRIVEAANRRRRERGLGVLKLKR